ncbi:hypothetical protein D9Q98_008679 [Chlorella vulgaris]|uniref:OCEL domain-containing protein n=1 Tax=Chlorella vulgaris TaxID=3077 RepID=A0A9D4TIF7_CHLVU|nr:hypothetical protein D9Q98_008679 [Chlorella vulgaris]
MASATGLKRVRFEVPLEQGAFAVQLRLTPHLLEALLGAQDAAQAGSIRFGDDTAGNAISIGDAIFPFKAQADERCDLLHLAPGSGGEGPSITAAVRQKLMVQRNIADERGRVRARADEAARQGQERKALLLSSKPSKQPKPQPRTVVQRHTPPLQSGAPLGQQQRGTTPPPRQLTASMLTGPAGKPPTHPAGAVRGATPPPSAAAAGLAAAPKAMAKTASSGKLGGRNGSFGNLGSMQAVASPQVLQAARGGASLRLCLIAMLAERSLPMPTVKAVLADVGARIRGFKAPGKEQLERVLKSVAEFKAPGLYVVYPMLLKELDELSPSAPGTASEAQHALGADAAPHARKKRAQMPEAPAATVPAVGEAGGGGSSRKPKAAGGKRGRQLDWTDDDSSDAEQQPPAAQRFKVRQPPAQQLAPAAVSNFSPSPPSVGPGGGSSSSGGALRRSSSSRGSEHADESWIQEHADRQPQPAAPINTNEEYQQRAAAFNSKYEVYFALHQLIEAHKKDFEALDAAINGAASEAEREQHRLELDRLFRRRGARAKRWDAAYSVLHQELAAAKSRMAEFVQLLQRQQQPGGSATAATAACVRVK